MHRYILFLLLSCWPGIGNLFSQACPDKNISTHPDNPVGEPGAVAKVNPFDWRENEFDIFSQYQTGSIVESPFFTVGMQT